MNAFHRRKAGPIFAFLVAVFIPLYPADASGSPGSPGSRESNYSRVDLHQTLKTPQEMIRYLEALYIEDKAHILAYDLARLYLQVGALSRAEDVLREDLSRKLDPFDAYESYSLLVGLYIDRKMEIPHEMIRDFDVLFRKMKKIAPRTLSRLEARAVKDGEEGEEDIINKTGGNEDEVEIQKRRITVYIKDPFQYERMLGDYYYDRNDEEKASIYYGSFYEDLDKPPASFVPRSMRNYTGILLKQGRTEEALLFLGYLVNLKPYMFSDLFRLAKLYYSSGDPTTALLVMMFINTLAEGYSILYYEESRAYILRLIEEMKNEPGEKKAVNLALVYLTGSNLSSVPFLVEGMQREGTENFFFHYLQGVSLFIAGEHRRALESFRAFQSVYPYLADAHCYAMLCMYNIDSNAYSEDILAHAEQAVALKPDTPVARVTKRHLAIMLGLREEYGEKLLLPSEVSSILDDFVNQGAEVRTLERLLTSLTIPRNSYQIAQVQLMSRVGARRVEYISYLKGRYGSLNEHGRRNASEILSALGENIK